MAISLEDVEDTGADARVVTGGVARVHLAVAAPGQLAPQGFQGVAALVDGVRTAHVPLLPGHVVRVAGLYLLDRQGRPVHEVGPPNPSQYHADVLLTEQPLAVVGGHRARLHGPVPALAIASVRVVGSEAGVRLLGVERLVPDPELRPNDPGVVVRPAHAHLSLHEVLSRRSCRPDQIGQSLRIATHADVEPPPVFFTPYCSPFESPLVRGEITAGRDESIYLGGTPCTSGLGQPDGGLVGPVGGRVSLWVYLGERTA
mmetsp:Transcript_13608/g.24283  ORF Transcript_13608/g.24283 Transcript_13608/m.24283 type:complete len:258 (+) Transcript_13608:5336-6109(+)